MRTSAGAKDCAENASAVQVKEVCASSAFETEWRSPCSAPGLKPLRAKRRGLRDSDLTGFANNETRVLAVPRIRQELRAQSACGM